ncbi:hypothetical protein [Conexibacter woesei]|uniref:Uncharacterized protein n=1 Tax=Conexibacter woesei (strain DSM 14684 / CCUG 47730 / CIP 108061 / JCM 11494 / NBRC 100937 / ID131577) TaxID=469383 RepID=D3F1Y9_CONWI|nr:hypothetical protein [Conexibacter woesei]ADB50164.1 hypothetical protein Cwoe_1737 [Conexibacter woesei DSM 14684]
MSQTITVKNVARGTVDLEGGRILAPGESGEAPDNDRTRAQIASELLVEMPATNAGDAS